MPDRKLTEAIAHAFSTGEPGVPALVRRASQAIGGPRPWLTPLARRYAAHFAGKTHTRYREAYAFLIADDGFRRARLKLSIGLLENLPRPRMRPVPAAADWAVPALASPETLADWLALTVDELEWFADLRGYNHRASRPQLTHYRYRVLPKRSGSPRLLEAPKRTLKLMQRQILHRILDAIPAHPSAQGFLRGRSIKTFVEPHVGREIVVRMDLRDFFPSIGRPRVQGLFRTIGYPEKVADLLGGLCTNAAPRQVWGEPPPGLDPRAIVAARALYAFPHLPQGAPTSPALANLCAWRLDCRLTGLAASAGATYTRYADDLAFSGDAVFARSAARFAVHAAAIALEEGFEVNHRKTRFMRQGVRQHLAGLAANQRLNVPRVEFKRLEAILTNCVRHGLATQNRDGHLAFHEHLRGRVAFFESINPSKGRRLRAIFDRIRESAPG